MPEQKATITIYHDTRRSKSGALYPVKLRVYFNYETRLYKTKIALSEEDFARSYLAEKPRGKYKDLQDELNSIKTRAIDIAASLPIFSFDRFEKRVKRPKGSGNNIFHHYDSIIKAQKEADKINTATNYTYSKKSLIAYLEFLGKNANKLMFEEVTPKFLADYERWMLAAGSSKTTVGIYLRPLRAIFHIAMLEENLPKENYPFGKKKFKIPGGRKVKKSLSKPELVLLANYEVERGSHQEKARDLWLFTYLANGMNIRDLCNLKQKDYNGTSIIFYRHKISSTAKDDLKPIIVPITDKAKTILEQYGNRFKGPELPLFPFFHKVKTEQERVRVSNNLVRFINQHLKRLAKTIGITSEVSCNWARHSFTTVSINNGASLEFIQDSLGHQNISTTMNYWDGFEAKQKLDNANNLL